MNLDYIRKNKAKTIAIAGILLIFAFMFYFLIIPEIINIDKYRYIIINQTAKNLQLPIEIGPTKATMTWNWGIIVQSKNLKIKHTDNTKYISTGPVDVEISIPYLFKHQIRVRNINIQNSEVTISRLSDGSFDIEDIVSQQYKKLIKYKTIFKGTNINLENYKIAFTDKFVSPNTKYLVFGNNLKISDFEPNKFISVDATGRIFHSSKPSTYFDIKYSGALPLNTKDILKNDIVLNGQVQNIYPDMFAAYLKHLGDYYKFMYITDSNFKINLHKDESAIDEISFTNDIQAPSAQTTKQKYTKLPFSEKTRVSVNIQKKEHDIAIKDVSIRNKDVDVAVLGNINNENPKTPDLDLNLAVNNSKLESVYSLFPKKFHAPFDIINKFKKYKVKGVLSANIGLKGNPKAPDIFGALEFKKTSLTKNTMTIKDTRGKIIFNNKEYNINANALLDKNTYIQASGYIAPQLKKVNLDIKSNNISLMPAQQLFLIIADISNIKAGALKKTYIKGRGNVNINISGNIKNPDYNGYLNFINTKIQYAGLSQPIENLYGQIKFAEKNICLANLKARIVQSPVSISGYIQKNKAEIVFASKKLNLGATRNLVLTSPELRTSSNIINELGDFSGLADAHLSFASDKKDKFSFNKLILKIIDGKTVYQNMPVNLTGGEIIFTTNGTTLKTLYGRIANSQVNIEGKINPSGKMKLLVKSKIDSNDIYNYINPRLIVPLEAKGMFPVIATISGTTEEWKLSAQAFLNKGDYLYLRQNPSMPLDKSRTVNLKLFGRGGIIAVDEIQTAAKDTPVLLSNYLSPHFIQAPIIWAAKDAITSHDAGNCAWNFACSSSNSLSTKYSLKWADH